MKTPTPFTNGITIAATLVAFIYSTSIPAQAEEASPAAKLLKMIEQHEDKTFGLEKQARVLENKGLVPIWDSLNEASPIGRFDVLAKLPIESITLGKESSRETFDLGIEEVRYGENGRQLDAAKWRDLLTQLKQDGYLITHSDWHQERFELNKDGDPVSDTRFTIQGNRNEEKDRLEVKATVRVTWHKKGDSFEPAHVEVLNGKVRRRSGEVAFAQALRLNMLARNMQLQSVGLDDGGGFFVYDLNGDQYPEIVLANHNIILWNNGNETLDPGHILAGGKTETSAKSGLIADLNGDGILDWLCDNYRGTTLEWHAGLKNMTTNGAFAEQAQRIPIEAHPLRAPTAITGGDIDHDGDIDVYVTQYRAPYESMPKEYWNANDGYGNVLLINDGKGNFTDGTAAAGLTAKQFRRTYSASFVDIDGDGDLDLVVVSDFCGTDLYLNDGKGKFTDVTDKDLDAPRTFGMSHTIADYDHDGKLDMYVTGMSSTTSRRLERMGAFPDGFDEANKMRSVMGYGNRMYLAKSGGGFAEPKYKDAVARTGWSWGSTSFDFDNDGDDDIYVGNGHITGKTTEDYCTSFWCRDIYLLPGVKGAEMKSYLDSIPNQENMSWDGYQSNSLLVNQAGNGFQDLGYMLDVGFDYDTRQVVATDFNLDGRVDLILTRQPETFAKNPTNKASHSVIIYRNVLKEAAERDWIGVTLTGTAKVSALGAIVELDTTNGKRRGTVISGDSFISQHPAQKHFGIKPGNKVKSITVIWPDGSTTVKTNPEIKRYYAMSPPAQN